MSGTAKKHMHKLVGNPSSLQNVKRRLVKKRLKLKPKAHEKTNQTSLSKKKNTGQGKGTGISRRNTLQKAIQHKSKSSKKQSSLSYQAEKLQTVNSKDKHENLDTRSVKFKRRRKKKRSKHAELDDAASLQRRTRYLLIKMNLEQNLIDAYSAEGWKGQSREKIRPEKELQRAKRQILKCKLAIREAIHQLDLLSSVGQIDDSAIAPDGSVHHEHIICAKCKLREAFPDNDIILCDGTCNCAFHQKCLDPPLLTANIPPGDEGWFCKFCKCKTEILEAINAHLGTHFAMDSNWEDIFKEEALLPEGGDSLFFTEQEWPSEDSEDDDFDPENIDNHSSIESGFSGEASSASSIGSLEDELLALTRRPENSSGYKDYSAELIAGLDYDAAADCEVLSGPRQRTAVDYIRLNDELFGKNDAPNEQNTEDEDWGPAKRKRKRNEFESDAASTLMTLCESKKNCQELRTNEVEKDSVGGESKRSVFRIHPSAVEKLRQAFTENELPSRTVREDLSKQLGLELEKVNKWFKNARYTALKSRKQVESTNTSHVTSPRASEECISETIKDKPAEQVAPRDVEENDAERSPSEKIVHLVTGLSKEKHVARASKQSIEVLQSTIEFGDDVSLKLLRERVKKQRRKLNFKDRDSVQEAEAEMEKLCRIKNKIERLQEVLLRHKHDRYSRADAPNLDEPLIMFVPVAELKDKR